MNKMISKERVLAMALLLVLLLGVYLVFLYRVQIIEGEEYYAAGSQMQTKLETVTARHRQIDAWNRTPVMERHALERLETVMEQAGELAHSDWVPFDELVNNTFAQNAVR